MKTHHILRSPFCIPSPYTNCRDYHEAEQYCVSVSHLLQELESQPQPGRVAEIEAGLQALRRPAGAIAYYFLRKRFLAVGGRSVDFDFERYLFAKIGEVYSSCVEIPRVTWASIVVLGSGVYVSGFVSKYAPLFVTMALAHVLVIVSLLVSRKLTHITTQLSPAAIPSHFHERLFESDGKGDSSRCLSADLVSPPAVHTQLEAMVFGKDLGLGFHDPPYLLLPAPNAASGIPLRQHQLFWFGAHGVHVMKRILTTQLLLTAAYSTIFVTYMLWPLSHPHSAFGVRQGDSLLVAVLLVALGVWPIMPCIITFAQSMIKFSLATAIEQLADKKLSAIIERRGKARRALDNLRRLSSLKVVTSKASSAAGGKAADIAPALRKELRDLFALIDNDNSGEVTMDEMKQQFQSMESVFQLEDTELESLLNVMDADGSGSVSEEEFINVMAMRSQGADRMSDEDFVEMLFSLCDTDGSGEFELQELFDVLKKAGQSWDLKDVQDLFNEVDTDQSGTIDRAEFLAFVHKISSQ